jgi:hypothetical protein
MRGSGAPSLATSSAIAEMQDVIEHISDNMQLEMIAQVKSKKV